MNHLLAALSEADSAFLHPNLEEVALAPRQLIESAGQEIEHVYFIEAGIAAVLTASGTKHIALGLIGSEGASGIAVFLGDTQSPHSTEMLTEGRGARIHERLLREAMEKRPELRRLLIRFSLAFYCQAAHTALSNASSTIEQRVARWILMANDRFAGHDVPLTHEAISYMLGVRRAGVTTAMDKLQRQGIIELRRGSLHLADRKALEQLASHFYGLPEKEFVRLVGTYWPPTASRPKLR